MILHKNTDIIISASNNPKILDRARAVGLLRMYFNDRQAKIFKAEGIRSFFIDCETSQVTDQVLLIFGAFNITYTRNSIYNLRIHRDGSLDGHADLTRYNLRIHRDGSLDEHADLTRYLTGKEVKVYMPSPTDDITVERLPCTCPGCTAVPPPKNGLDQRWEEECAEEKANKWKMPPDAKISLLEGAPKLHEHFEVNDSKGAVISIGDMVRSSARLAYRVVSTHPFIVHRSCMDGVRIGPDEGQTYPSRYTRIGLLLDTGSKGPL